MASQGRDRATAKLRRRACALLVVGLVLGLPAAASAQQEGFTPITPTKYGVPTIARSVTPAPFSWGSR